MYIQKLQQSYKDMKHLNSKTKTQQSLQKIKAINERKERQSISFSNYRKKNKINTPVRFADIHHHHLIKKDRQLSTNHQSNSNHHHHHLSKINNHLHHQINQAIDILKEISSKQIGRHQHNSTLVITPFQLNPNPKTNHNDHQWMNGQIFQEQLSFKGAANKMHLLRQIQIIQTKISSFKLHIISLKPSSHLLNKIEPSELKASNHELDKHFQTIHKMMDEFIIQINRCKDIMDKISTGITQNTMNTYLQKLTYLINKIQDNIGYLQNYINLITKNKHEVNNNNNKNMVKLKFKYPLMVRQENI